MKTSNETIFFAVFTTEKHHLHRFEHFAEEKTKAAFIKWIDQRIEEIKNECSVKNVLITDMKII